MGCPSDFTIMVDAIPISVSVKSNWTLSILVWWLGGKLYVRLYVNVAESFLTSLTTVFSGTGTVTSVSYTHLTLPTKA